MQLDNSYQNNKLLRGSLFYDIYPMIEISDFENMEDAEAIDKLTEELFYKIYQGKYGDLYSK